MPGEPGTRNCGRVLIVEDDIPLARLMVEILSQYSYAVRHALNGEVALRLMCMQLPEVVILDIGLPGKRDGLEVCRLIRTRHEVGILIVSARDRIADRLFGFEAGADDYLCKPFGTQELVLRVGNVVRRLRARNAPARPVCDLDRGLAVDLVEGIVRRGTEHIPLAETEKRVMSCLISRLGEVVAYDDLIAEVWGPEYAGEASRPSLRVHIRQLRQKLGDDRAEPRYLFTHYGRGYRLQASHAQAS